MSNYPLAFEKWIATRSDEAVFQVRNGYFPVDTVLDAYVKGIEQGNKNSLEKAREVFYEKSKELENALNNVVKTLNDNGISPSTVFLSHNLSESKMMFIVPKESFYSEVFVDTIYPKTYKIKEEASEKGVMLQVNFIHQSDDIDFGLIEADGFGFKADFPIE